MLNQKQRAHLKSLGHRLEPKLKLGKAGVSDGFVKELEQALSRDELVKVRFGKLVEVDPHTLAERCASELVAVLGKTAVFYRQGAEARITLP